MRRFLFASLGLVFFSAACGPRYAPPSTNISTPTVSARAPEIRFALIGEPRDVNVWALFDKKGASYADYALRSEYWLRLYRLVPPEFTFEPFAASGLPSDFVQEGNFYSSTVKLREDLKWTDGSAFTAEDVAFTVNAVLALELNFDWGAFYSRDSLDRVEVVNSYAVKFVFKQKPNVGVWQYGALQGPIAQKVFWAPRIANALDLLPEDSARVQIDHARAYLATVQYDIGELTAQLDALRSEGRGDRGLEGQLTRKQRELNYAQNNLDKALEKTASKINAAHEAVYALDDAGEPTLGAWLPADKQNGAWVNAVNPNFPLVKPNFDRATYRVFANEADALVAFQNNEVDFILSPNGVSKNIKDAKVNSTDSARFLVFNPLKPQFAEPALRAALSCMIDRQALATALRISQNAVAPLDAFILSTQWHNPEVRDACAEMDNAARTAYAVALLKSAGYSWMQEPTAESAGKILLMPNGKAFPKIRLSAPSKQSDATRAAAAKYIAEQAQRLGVPLVVSAMSVNAVVYAVYSSQKYDAALIGWRLSEYPAYLCDWFGGKNPPLYNGAKFKSACDALNVETNMDAVRTSFYQIESTLMSELPFIPLFTVARADVYQNLAYPTQKARNGWGGLRDAGAPSFAIPAP